MKKIFLEGSTYGKLIFYIGCLEGPSDMVRFEKGPEKMGLADIWGLFLQGKQQVQML